MDPTTTPASQSYANTILIAPVIAWGFSIILGTHAVTRASDSLFGRGKRKRRKSSIPFADSMLAAATVFVVAQIAICIWELADYSVRQDRSAETVAFRPCRAYAPLPVGFTSAITQSFMAIRCWRLAHRSKIFASVTALLILTSFSAVMAFSGLLIAGPPAMVNYISLTLAMLYSCASLLVDTIITTVLVRNLYNKKKDSATERSIAALDRLIRLAFETCAIPGFAVLASCVTGSVAFSAGGAVRSTYWGLTAITPALYLLSFVYCLEATTTRLQSGQQPDFTNSAESMKEQCLCRYVQPFVMKVSAQLDAGRSLDSLAQPIKYHWDPPQDWASGRLQAATLPAMPLPIIALPEDNEQLAAFSLPGTRRDHRRMSRSQSHSGIDLSISQHSVRSRDGRQATPAVSQHSMQLDLSCRSCGSERQVSYHV